MSVISVEPEVTSARAGRMAPIWLIAASLVFFALASSVLQDVPQIGRLAFGAASGLSAAAVVLFGAQIFDACRLVFVRRLAKSLLTKGKPARIEAFGPELEPWVDLQSDVEELRVPPVSGLFANPRETLSRYRARAARLGPFQDILERGSRRIQLDVRSAFGAVLIRATPLDRAEDLPHDEIAILLDPEGAVRAASGPEVPDGIQRAVSSAYGQGHMLEVGDVIDGHVVTAVTNTLEGVVIRLLKLKAMGGQDGYGVTAISDTIELLPLPVLKVRVDGSIEVANAAARDLLGLEAETEQALFNVLDGPGRAVSDWLADAFAGRSLGRTEVVRTISPGRDVFVQVAFTRIEEADGPALLAVLTDATELKTLEAQFVQSQKMQAIGQLAGGVAHDFNNLLTAISGHADLMLLRHDEGDPDYGDLMQITQNANRAAALVGQLLAFSRKQTLSPEHLDLRDTMADLAHLLNRLVGEKIHLDVTHDPDLQFVRADRRQFEQVVMNLVVNARDAMPGGGIIRIATENRKLDVPVKRDRADVPVGNYVQITVDDDGIGIPPDRLPKIFEPFYTSKKVGEGTGLGLSTAYGIVKQTGGFIFAESVPDEGSRFTILLPAHDPASVTQHPVNEPKTSEAPAPNTTGTVLLVEDEAPVRAFASRALRLRGHSVLEADSAEDALHILEDMDIAIDIFVTDVIMPGMDGPTWVAKALEARPDTRVVFVSGYAEDGVTETQARIPNSVFLPKPFSLKDLTTTVQDQLLSLA